MKYSLKELRQQQHMTQREVAAKLGVSVYTYRQWERYPAKLPVSKADRLCQYFGVTLDQLIF